MSKEEAEEVVAALGKEEIEVATDDDRVEKTSSRATLASSQSQKYMKKLIGGLGMTSVLCARYTCLHSSTNAFGGYYTRNGRISESASACTP